MEKAVKGWVVMNIGHPTTGSRTVDEGSFAYTRSESIGIFIRGSGQTWEYWKRKWNFRCVKATRIVRIEE